MKDFTPIGMTNMGTQIDWTAIFLVSNKIPEEVTKAQKYNEKFNISQKCNRKTSKQMQLHLDVILKNI